MADTELIAAVRKLVKAKGRYHTEQNYMALVAALDAHDVQAASSPAAVPDGALPPKMSWLDAPHDVPNDQASAWSKGWNACRAAVSADRAQRPDPLAVGHLLPDPDRSNINAARNFARAVADRAQQGEPVAASGEFWRERVAENAADVAAEHVDMSMMYDEFRRLKSILKTPGYCDGTKYTERQAFYMAIATKAATPADAPPSERDVRREAARLYASWKQQQTNSDQLAPWYRLDDASKDGWVAKVSAPVPDTGIPTAGGASFQEHPAYVVACKMGNALFNLMQSDDLPERWQKSCAELVKRWDESRRAPVSSTPTAGAVEGWKWVPVEPTEAMMDAAEACSSDWPRTTWKAAFASMLAAAPQPPEDDS